ncbi:MAG: hypothetical protein QM750_27950 [Rubrivivax sp.]
MVSVIVVWPDDSDATTCRTCTSRAPGFSSKANIKSWQPLLPAALVEPPPLLPPALPPPVGGGLVVPPPSISAELPPPPQDASSVAAIASTPNAIPDRSPVAMRIPFAPAPVTPRQRRCPCGMVGSGRYRRVIAVVAGRLYAEAARKRHQPSIEWHAEYGQQH